MSACQGGNGCFGNAISACQRGDGCLGNGANVGGVPAHNVYLNADPVPLIRDHPLQATPWCSLHLVASKTSLRTAATSGLFHA